MATGPKPRTATGYNADLTVSCERTLLTLLGAFGTLKDTLRLVGGLVPRYLTPAAPPDVPAHAGTSDVDVVLNLALIAGGEGYASLADQLEARGFARQVNDAGKPSSWRWQRQVDEHTYVLVEFLRDADGATPGRVVSVDGERVSALCLAHAGIVHDWYQEREIRGQLLDGGGHASEVIRYADVPAFVILKALALADRQENKDAADLIHVLQYAGDVAQVADLFVQKLRSQQHADAIAAGLDALRRCFCDDEHAQGHEKLGAVAYAAFHDDHDDEEQLVRDRRMAAGLVQAILDVVGVRSAT
jgi:hypothetical protein